MTIYRNVSTSFFCLRIFLMFLFVLILCLINSYLGLIPGGKIKLVKSGAIFLQIPKRHVSNAFFSNLLHSNMLLFAVTLCSFPVLSYFILFLIMFVLNWNLFQSQSLEILSNIAKFRLLSVSYFMNNIWNVIYKIWNLVQHLKHLFTTMICNYTEEPNRFSNSLLSLSYLSCFLCQ